MPGNDGTTRFISGSSLTSSRLVATAGLTSTMPAIASGWSAASRNAERPAHRQSADDDGVVGLAHACEDPRQLGVPVAPAHGVELLPRGAVTGQERHLHAVPELAEVPAPGLDRGRRAGEAVAEQDADPAATGQLGAARDRQRLGLRVDRHARDCAASGGDRLRAGGEAAGVVSGRRVGTLALRCACWWQVGRSGSRGRMLRCCTGSSSGLHSGRVLKFVFRPQTEGVENVPDDGPAILASNHLSYADWLFMPLTLPRRVTFVAKAEYFNSPGIKGWFQKQFFSGVGQVPIDRSGASARPPAPSPRPSGSSTTVTSSGSTPRAPARTTASSTAARPAWPGSRWRRRCR